jgi:putative two-component system response regulator
MEREGNLSDKKRILVVDDETWNLSVLESYLLPQDFEVFKAKSAGEALELLGRVEKIDIVLSDVLMPVMDGFELCREIKKIKKFQSLPILLVTALQDTVDKVKGLQAGASDFLSKPVDPSELRARVCAHLRIKTLIDEVESWAQVLEQKVRHRTKVIEEKNRQLDNTYFLTMEALILALDAREQETGKHSLRVSFYVTELAGKFNIQGKMLEEIAIGGLLHDLGKIGIPDNILLKPSALTPEERNEIGKHPQSGWNMVKDIEFFGMGRDLVLQHQERYDGSGYPQHLKGEEIFIGARLFAVVDVLDAMMSKRPYKNALSYEESHEFIKKNRGILFDPAAVDAFLAIPKERWFELRESVQHGNFKSFIMEKR